MLGVYDGTHALRRDKRDKRDQRTGRCRTEDVMAPRFKVQVGKVGTWVGRVQRLAVALGTRPCLVWRLPPQRKPNKAINYPSDSATVQQCRTTMDSMWKEWRGRGAERPGWGRARRMGWGEAAR